MQTKPGTGMICGMIRPEGMSRPVGKAMQTKPGTDMIRPEGMSRPEMTIPGTGMICEPEGMSRRAWRYDAPICTLGTIF